MHLRALEQAAVTRVRQQQLGPRLCQSGLQAPRQDRWHRLVDSAQHHQARTRQAMHVPCRIERVPQGPGRPEWQQHPHRREQAVKRGDQHQSGHWSRRSHLHGQPRAQAATDHVETLRPHAMLPGHPVEHGQAVAHQLRFVRLEQRRPQASVEKTQHMAVGQMRQCTEDRSRVLAPAIEVHHAPERPHSLPGPGQPGLQHPGACRQGERLDVMVRRRQHQALLGARVQPLALEAEQGQHRQQHSAA